MRYFLRRIRYTPASWSPPTHSCEELAVTVASAILKRQSPGTTGFGPGLLSHAEITYVTAVVNQEIVGKSFVAVLVKILAGYADWFLSYTGGGEVAPNNETTLALAMGTWRRDQLAKGGGSKEGGSTGGVGVWACGTGSFARGDSEERRGAWFSLWSDLMPDWEGESKCGGDQPSMSFAAHLALRYAENTHLYPMFCTRLPGVSSLPDLSSVPTTPPSLGSSEEDTEKRR